MQLLQEKDLQEGTVVITREQAEGRGQRGNKWISEAGMNLTFTIVLYPHFLEPAKQFGLSQAVSLGISDHLEKTLKGLKPRIKWPNDIYVNGGKISGILIENVLSGNKISFSLIGIGLNVNQTVFGEGVPNACSMRTLSGLEFDLEDCLSSLCACLERRYLQLKAGDVAGLEADCSERQIK